jgi:ribosome biogenesis protein YTM1
VPSADEVPLDQHESSERKKRRKAGKDESDGPRRKAPITVLKSHIGRVSKALFGHHDDVAYSCGFDSTVRTWDVENGVCTNTIVRSP